jgi:hypothetical protein
MRIIQIATAHIAQGEEPEIIGLGDDGIVYIYRQQIEPVKSYKIDYTQVQELPDLIVNVNAAPTPYLRQQALEAKALELMRQQNCQSRHSDPEWSTQYDPSPCMSPWQHQKAPEPVPVPTKPVPVRVEVFQDGWTEGWYPLTMQFSKTICHPEDPTRAERS